ncbi:hypothetical protein, partial [Hungatella effluvii]|uniref:hypothetical protein n=1 Tax=Hungatella effluvii TaxID=1096246 RepID=UPI0022E36D60
QDETGIIPLKINLLVRAAARSPPLKTFRKNGTLLVTKQEQERYHAIERTTVPLRGVLPYL